MKVIGRAGVGIDNIDVAEATRKGVLVMNTPGGNTVSTAQLAISLLCSAARLDAGLASIISSSLGSVRPSMPSAYGGLMCGFSKVTHLIRCCEMVLV